MIAATPKPRRQKRQWTSRADRFLLIAATLREFCCYASVREICNSLSASGHRAHDFKVTADLLELVKAGTVDRVGSGGRRSPYLYCLVNEDIPAPPQVFNKLPPPNPSLGGRASAASLTPAERSSRSRRVASHRWQQQQKITAEQTKAAVNESGSVAAAAKALGLSRETIYKRLRSIPPVEKPPPEPPTPRLAPVPLTPPPPGLDLDALWNLYQTDRGRGIRNAIAEHYIKLVGGIHAKLANTLPSEVDTDSLSTAGHFGLLEAIEHFDPARGVKFNSYAPRIIKGRMLDELRKMDFVPRLVRVQFSKLRAAADDFFVRTGREPTTAELASDLEISISSLEQMQDTCRRIGVISLDKAQYQNDAGDSVTDQAKFIDRTASDPSRRLRDREFLHKITTGLNKSERLIVIAYYFEDQTMREIGEQLGLSESRVSRMHSNIIERLQRKFGRSERVA